MILIAQFIKSNYIIEHQGLKVSITIECFCLLYYVLYILKGENPKHNTWTAQFPSLQQVSQSTEINVRSLGGKAR
jgi:hypothetical protein